MPDAKPLRSLEEWEDFVGDVYSTPLKTQDQFRNYDDPARSTVREFYRLNHQFQTLDFAEKKRADFVRLNRKELTIWEACDFLNELVDDSDPDTDLSQLQHLMQTSEAIRADGHPDWFVLAGFVHDLGKVLCLFGEPQWAVVGDTFPLGCRFSEKIVYAEYFEANPDFQVAEYQTQTGIYSRNCGLRNVVMSWGHDEYVYHMMRDFLPEPALYMLRFHSFYAQHRENAYEHLMDAHDQEMFTWVKRFNPYDLYSKQPTPPDVDKLRSYYDHLFKQYLPEKLYL